MSEVILYTKEGCTLCDKVKLELKQLASQYPHQLTEIDITQDEELFKRYRFHIPVVHTGQIKLRAPITTTELESALASIDSS